MKKAFLLAILGISCVTISAQDLEFNSDTVSLLFMGDIMGHDSQIAAAYDSGTYDYSDVFKRISPIIQSADFSIANLEVTLSGPPYVGYPKFSSPDELVVACKRSGLDVLVTSNNHSNDRGKLGMIRTLNSLDSLEIKHTGTFRDSIERDSTNLLVLTKNSIKIGVLNYTYGTNRKTNDYPVIVNKIDTLMMGSDIEKSKYDSLDKLIVVLHWGKEYISYPNAWQKEISKFLFKNGADIIIGSHPHVLQPMEYYAETDSTKEKFIAYSLGNFVSGQRKRKRDGGAMLKLELIKNEGKTIISNPGYYLTWVNKPVVSEKAIYEIISCTDYEVNESLDLDEASTAQMKIFRDDSRKLLQKDNIEVNELLYYSFIDK